MERINGVVRWFNEATGYGFIEVDGMKDIFVHHSSIQAEGFRTLTEGDKVQFEVEKTPKGLQAKDVVVTEKAPKKQKEA